MLSSSPRTILRPSTWAATDQVIARLSFPKLDEVCHDVGDQRIGASIIVLRACRKILLRDGAEFSQPRLGQSHHVHEHGYGITRRNVVGEVAFALLRNLVDKLDCPEPKLGLHLLYGFRRESRH